MADKRQPLRRYLERRLGGAGWLRTQTFLVLAASFLVGGLASHLLLRLGVSDLRLRLPRVVVVSYGAFLGLVGVWLRATGLDVLKVRLDPQHVEPPTEGKDSSAASRLADRVETVGDGVSGIADLASVDAEGCLPAIGIAVAAAVIGLVALVLWWIIGGFLGAASAALLEAGVEAVLAVGMARAVGGGAASWVEGALRASWLFWLLLVGAAFGLAVLLRTIDPAAATVFQAVAAFLSGSG